MEHRVAVRHDDALDRQLEQRAQQLCHAGAVHADAPKPALGAHPQRPARTAEQAVARHQRGGRGQPEQRLARPAQRMRLDALGHSVPGARRASGVAPRKRVTVAPVPADRGEDAHGTILDLRIEPRE